MPASPRSGRELQTARQSASGAASPPSVLGVARLVFLDVDLAYLGSPRWLTRESGSLSRGFLPAGLGTRPWAAARALRAPACSARERPAKPPRSPGVPGRHEDHYGETSAARVGSGDNGERRGLVQPPALAFVSSVTLCKKF